MTGKDDKHLPYDLENLSVPELEALLQQDFLASDGSSPDVDYIMAIVEVMHQKEQAQPDYQPLDTAKAWEELKSFYIAEEANSIDRSDEGPKEKVVEPKTAKRAPKHEKAKIFRRCLLVAACLCLLVALTCAPVFGHYSIFQMLARWTAEQFGFYMPSETHSAPEQIPEEFAEFQNIMEELGAELIIPKFPEGYVAKEPTLDYFPDNGILKFSIVYQQENDYYLFVIYKNENQIANLYEKSNSLVEIKTYNDIDHYYLENSGNSTVAWYIGTTEYYILSNKSISDLKQILESTYDR